MIFRSIALVVASAAGAQAERVEITLVDVLDGQLSNYCLDIPGVGAEADPARPMHAHTCYSHRGSLSIDQAFDSSRLAEGVLYMPEFDVCAAASVLDSGATLDLARCDNSARQTIGLESDGTIRPAFAGDLCVTAGRDTRSWQNGAFRYQIKAVTLEACTTELAAYQTWRTRSENN